MLGAMAKSTTVSTPYTTHSRRTIWFKEQKQTYKPWEEISGRHQPRPECRTHQKRTWSPPPRGIWGQEPRQGDQPPPRASRHDWERINPSIVEVERNPDTPIKVSGMTARLTALPFSNPFSIEIINIPWYGKVKMPM